MSVNNNLNKKIGVIGSGAWGTALAQSLANSGHEPIVYGHDNSLVEKINESKKHPSFSNVDINKNILFTFNMNDLIDCDVLLSAIPTQVTTDFWNEHETKFKKSKAVVICSKGISIKHKDILSNTLSKSIQSKLLILSGPTFAKPAVEGMPMAATIASKNTDISMYIQSLWNSKFLRLYSSTDIIGVQVSGAVKNVIAIASGIVMSKNLGLNSLYALITRGLNEITMLGVAMGGNIKTFSGLSGAGDLFLTCTNDMSRNTKLGIAIGSGETLINATKLSKGISEGVYTAKIIKDMSIRYDVEMPICNKICDIVNEKTSIDDAIQSLLNEQNNMKES